MITKEKVITKMTELKYGSKKATALAQNYWHSHRRTLEECYSSHSRAKENADFWCRARMVECGGYDYRICTFNSQMFTCGYRFKEKGVEYLAYETPMYTYKIRLY